MGPPHLLLSLLVQGFYFDNEKRINMSSKNYRKNDYNFDLD